MQKNNIKLSVALNKIIEPIVRENYRLCKIDSNNEEFLLFLRDSDIQTGFYFGFIREEPNGTNGHTIQCSNRPANSAQLTAITQTIKLSDLGQVLKNWFINVGFYQTESILNDPILTGYEKEFYNDLKIIDGDSDYNPFNYQQQLLLDRFLNNVINNIDEVQDERNKDKIQEIINETQNLQEDATSLSKNAFMSRLSFIFAKARKGGLKISEFLLKEFAKEILKESAKPIFDFAVNHTGDIAKYIKALV